MKQWICFRGLFALLANTVLILHCAMGQVDLEDSVPESALENHDVRVVIQRLKILRRNLAGYGERHPNYRKALDSIAANEMQLKKLLESENKLNPFLKSNRPTVPPKNLSSPPTKVPTNKPADLSPAMSIPAKIGKYPQWKMPNWALRHGLNYELSEVKERNSLGSFDKIGAFPALGLLWAIESDQHAGHSRLLRWHLLPSMPSRQVIWETTGEIIDAAIAPDFSESGQLYVVRAAPMKPHTSNRMLEIVALKFNPEPPFELTSSDSILARLHQQNALTRSVPSRNGVLYLLGSLEKPTFVVDGFEYHDLGGEVHRISPRQSNDKPKDRNVNQQAPLIDAANFTNTH